MEALLRAKAFEGRAFFGFSCTNGSSWQWEAAAAAVAWLRQCLHRPLPQQAPDPITPLQYPTHNGGSCFLPWAPKAKWSISSSRSRKKASWAPRHHGRGRSRRRSSAGAVVSCCRDTWHTRRRPTPPLPDTSPSLAFFLALNPDSDWSTFHGDDRRTSSGSEEALARSALLSPLTSPGILSRGHGAPSDSSANSDAVAEGAGAGATPT